MMRFNVIFSVGLYAVVGPQVDTVVDVELDRSFRPDRILIPIYNGIFFSLLGITRDGKVVDAAWIGPIPGITASEQAPPFLVHYPEVQAGHKIGLLVRNTDQGPHEFRASLIGHNVKGEWE